TPFVIVNFLPLLAIFTGISRTAITLFIVTYVVRLVSITAGYHRYFAHRSYRLARAPQFLLAAVGLTAVQKGPLWWASHHRNHHRYADTERDPHSPQKGFWWSHAGWITSGQYGNTKDYSGIEDFARYPELRWLNEHDWIGGWALGLACLLIGGWSGLVVGFFASTVVLWHVTFAINSFAHLFGDRRYATTDTSRNGMLLALLTFGEGWHNNHHHYPRCARQGLRWWEIDITYMLLRLGRLVGIVHDIREPPAAVRLSGRIRDGAADLGLIRYHLSRAASLAEASGSDAIVELLDSTASQAAAMTRAPRSPDAPASESELADADRS
ncbi:MAG: Delta-9 acyl-phospholipid desaturase, partial [Acidimicrobiia bacterium]|nr:Delta-9 acyl-phospholipid desaturase [Acidimicrobiia bacterium]